VLLVGSALLSSSPAGAQQAGSTINASPAGLPSVAFNVVRPGFATYYQQHGGLRTLGSPLSNDFQLLGLRVQILERQVLQQHPDGTVTAMDLLNKAMPLTHADGATFPSADPDLVSALPSLTSPTYTDDALAAIDAGLLDAQVPDAWNDLPVNFNATFRATVTCDDLPVGMPCDDHALLSGALDVWGLPTSGVTQDPNDLNRIYQRFQRGIMQYTVSDGVTQAVPLGDWFRRVLQDQGVPDDLRADLSGSRFLGEYSPSQPLGVARPLDLPATSLTAAFGNATTDSSTTTTTDASANTAVPSGPSSVFGSALPNFGQTPSPTPVVSANPATQPQPAVSGTPAPSSSPAPASTGPDPCAGDEQIMFSPNKPYANTDVLVSVTSARHHNASTVRLTGPVKPSAVNERQGLNGWVWEWTVSPAVDGWYEFSFWTDGARKCATSGFNALPAFGVATATPVTAIPTATLVPTITPTPTATPVSAPVLNATADPASGATCGTLLHLTGTNFGTTQSELQGNVIVNISGGSKAATIQQWNNTNILISLPTPLPAGTYQIVVTTTAGISSPLNYQVGACPTTA
jgi:hypothetical protein